MTPFAHTTSDIHVSVYRQDVGDSIRESRAHPAMMHSLRRHIARALVRTGAWLLPDKSEVIGGTVFVLPQAPNDRADQQAA